MTWCYRDDNMDTDEGSDDEYVWDGSEWVYAGAG